jgi:DNA-binding NarL/FixJ family response regulator
MRTFLIDTQPVFREGLKQVMRAVPDIEVVGEADTCGDVIDKARKDCDLFILDGELDSFAFLRSLRKKRSSKRPPFTLVISRHTEDHYAVQMLAAGADGYLSKLEPPQLVLEAIRKVSRGRKYISRRLAETMVLNLNQAAAAFGLSNREYQVLYMMASGRAMKEIAWQLSLSAKTVSAYRCRLLEKLKLESDSQLVQYAIKEGISECD